MKKMFKKMFKAYIEGVNEFYAPLIKYNIPITM